MREILATLCAQCGALDLDVYGAYTLPRVLHARSVDCLLCLLQHDLRNVKSR